MSAELVEYDATKVLQQPTSWEIDALLSHKWSTWDCFIQEYHFQTRSDSPTVCSDAILQGIRFPAILRHHEHCKGNSRYNELTPSLNDTAFYIENQLDSWARNSTNVIIHGERIVMRWRMEQLSPKWTGPSAAVFTCQQHGGALSTAQVVSLSLGLTFPLRADLPFNFAVRTLASLA